MSESVMQNEKSFGFDAFWLKIIAAAAMLCDHVAYVFLDDNYAMRAFGRLAFPIFAFFIAQGYLYTRDVKKYALRLFIFALIAQAPYALAFGHSFFAPNVILTLFLGLVSIWAYDKGNAALKLAVPLLALFLAEATGSDHGAFGVAMVFLFYAAKPLRLKLIAAAALIVLMFLIYSFQMGSLNAYAAMLLFYIVPLFLIALYNGKKGIGGAFSKWFFYIFYPMHLTAIWLVKIILFK